jgi:type VI secretion system FHA domain protein
MPLRLKIVSQHKDSVGENHTREFIGCGGTIGRSLENDWALPDAQRYLSSRQAMIDCKGSTFYLFDTSRNGVFLNGSEVPIGKGSSKKLKDGDLIRMADYEFLARITIDKRIKLDDGMQDSIVRTQLVKEDTSKEIPMLAEANMSEPTLDDVIDVTKSSGRNGSNSNINSQK